MFPLRFALVTALFLLIFNTITAQQDAKVERYADCVQRFKKYDFLYANGLISDKNYRKQLMKDSCAAYLGRTVTTTQDSSIIKQANPQLALQYKIERLQKQGQRSTEFMGVGLGMIGAGFAFIYIKPNEGRFYNIRKGVGVAFLSAGALFEFIGIIDKLSYKVKKDNLQLKIGMLQSGNVGVNYKW